MQGTRERRNEERRNTKLNINVISWQEARGQKQYHRQLHPVSLRSSSTSYEWSIGDLVFSTSHSPLRLCLVLSHCHAEDSINRGTNNVYWPKFCRKVRMQAAFRHGRDCSRDQLFFVKSTRHTLSWRHTVTWDSWSLVQRTNNVASCGKRLRSTKKRLTIFSAPVALLRVPKYAVTPRGLL